MGIMANEKVFCKRGRRNVSIQLLSDSVAVM